MRGNSAGYQYVAVTDGVNPSYNVRKVGQLSVQRYVPTFNATGSAITASGSQTFTLVPGQIGLLNQLFVGSQLLWDTTGSGVQETVTLTAWNPNTGVGAATFAHTHVANAQVNSTNASPTITNTGYSYGSTTWSYTGGDGTTIKDGTGASGSYAGLEAISVNNSAGTAFSNDTLRQLIHFGYPSMGKGTRRVTYRFRLLTLDNTYQASIAGSLSTTWFSGPFPTQTQPAGGGVITPSVFHAYSPTYNKLVDKCDGTGSSGVNDPRYALTGNPIDLTPWVVSATITQDMTRPVQRTMTMSMNDTADSNTIQLGGGVVKQAPIDYFKDFVEPIVRIWTDSTNYIETSLGIFRFMDPDILIGGYAASRNPQLSDYSYTIQRTQATDPATATNVSGGGANTNQGIANSSSHPIQILGSGSQYSDTAGINLTSSAFTYNIIQNGVTFTYNTSNPCCTANETYGFIYMADVIRAMLTNDPNHPCLPGCGIPNSWIHSKFPKAPSTAPPAGVNGPAATFNWTLNGGVVDADAPIMDMVVPLTDTQTTGFTFQEGISYLDQINLFLKYCNFDGLWFDDSGNSGNTISGGVTPLLRATPWPANLNYAAMAPQWVYDTTKDSIVEHGVSQSFSLDNACNVVNYVQEDSGRNTVFCWVENNNPASPISVGNFGSRLVQVIRESNVPYDLVLSAASIAKYQALYHLNLGASVIDTIKFNSAINPLHGSGDLLALNIYQRFFGISDPRNQIAVASGFAQTGGDSSYQYTISDRFRETAWEISINTRGANENSLPANLPPTAALGQGPPRMSGTMSHTCQRVSNITPDSVFNALAGTIVWTGDT